MALFTDGPPASIEDLTGHDSHVLDIASTEGIDITRKLVLEHEKLGIELEELLERAAFTGRRFSTGQVVITPPLRLWHIYRTLESTYADAYNSQLNDRYAGRRDEFRKLATWACDRLAAAGIGMVRDPVARAATPEVSTVQGGLPDGVYYVTMSWLNGSGEEGECAVPASATAMASALVVRPGAAPAGATRWNVYAGTDPESMTLQNATPIALGENWLLPPVANGGRKPGSGQAPNWMQPLPRLIQRG